MADEKDQIPAEGEKPLHAPAPETVDMAKEREEQDKMRNDQNDLFKKQAEERRQKQAEKDKKKK